MGWVARTYMKHFSSLSVPEHPPQTHLKSPSPPCSVVNWDGLAKSGEPKTYKSPSFCPLENPFNTNVPFVNLRISVRQIFYTIKIDEVGFSQMAAVTIKGNLGLGLLRQSTNFVRVTRQMTNRAARSGTVLFRSIRTRYRNFGPKNNPKKSE